MDWISLTLITAFMTGFLGTWCVRRYALERSLLDVPNERSSHSIATPRGGGLSVSIAVITGVVILYVIGQLPEVVLIALLPSCMFVAVIGWIDDHRALPAVVRGTAYLMAAAWFVGCSGVMPEIPLGILKVLGSSIEKTKSLPFEISKQIEIPKVMIGIVLTLGIAWLTNLYNFMDGTDGLAGLQAVLAGVAGGWLLWEGGDHGLAMLAWITAASCVGFLIWNWAPAKIFMGDVGSCLLGFVFGCLSVLGEMHVRLPALLWVILLGYFIWDATLTLLLRIFSGERWYEAHKSHAYQRLVQMGLGHGQLAGLFFIFNLLVLWPLTLWGYLEPAALLWALLLSIFAVALVWGVVQWRFRQLQRIG